MRTAKPKIENIQELQLYINILRRQCIKKEQIVKQNINYFSENKGKILFKAFNPLVTTEGKTMVAKVIESSIIPIIAGKTGGPIAEVFVRIVSLIGKKYSEKGIGRLFKRKQKVIDNNHAEDRIEHY